MSSAIEYNTFPVVWGYLRAAAPIYTFFLTPPQPHLVSLVQERLSENVDHFVGYSTGLKRVVPSQSLADADAAIPAAKLSFLNLHLSTPLHPPISPLPHS